VQADSHTEKVVQNELVGKSERFQVALISPDSYWQSAGECGILSSRFYHMDGT